jgi:DNA helicase IV
VLWSIFEHLRTELNERNAVTWPGMFGRLAEHLSSTDKRPFDFAVVDEAQDVSPMQWRMLGRRGRHASWTVVGDPAQSAWTGDPEELARARNVALRGRRHSHTLTTNYRNPVEIFDLAASVIRTVAPEAPLPTPVRATGVVPEHRQVPPADLPAAVRSAASELLAQVEGTVGVITPAGLDVTGWLPDDPRLSAVTGLSAKGMEYDGVLLVEPGQLRAEASTDGAGARTLYVALSRATQRLTTVATRPWRP